MPGKLDLALLLRWINLLGVTLAAARLLWAGLHTKYRVFFAYMIFLACRSGLLLALDLRGPLYAKLWILTEPVLWIFYVALVLELYALILKSHKGLYTLGRWALYAAVTIALLLSLISLAAPSRDPFNQSRLIALMLVIERGLLLSVVLFLILILAFLSRYPITLTRNVVIHSIVYSLFFLSHTLAFLIRSMLGYEVARPVNLALSGTSALCALAWAALLRKEGENLPVRLYSLWSRSREKVLVEQLDSINAALLRAARK